MILLVIQANTIPQVIYFNKMIANDDLILSEAMRAASPLENYLFDRFSAINKFQFWR